MRIFRLVFSLSRIRLVIVFARGYRCRHQNIKRRSKAGFQTLLKAQSHTCGSYTAMYALVGG